jgi:4-amino-4-deoxy-L-arabinose transferase-like glycosyltransferase
MSKILKRLRNTPYFLLFLVILLATAYRFYSLSSLPVSPYWDEVSIGYNAYSIGVNGKDEYGVTMPLLFKAYSDYKLPIYIYLSVIPIKILGLSEFSVRFASAFFGVLTVGLTFFSCARIIATNRYWWLD